MATVFPLFPSKNPMQAAKPSIGISSRAATQPAMPKFLAVRNGVYYFKRKIPAGLVAEFGDRKQIWKSLGTADFTLACRELAKEVAAFELRATAARLRAASDAVPKVPTANVTALRPGMISALVERYYIHMLEREEQELQASRTITMPELAERKAAADEALQYYQMALICGDVTAVDETANQILAGEGLYARPGSTLRHELCERLLAKEVDVLREQRARLDGNRRPTPAMPLPIRLQPTLMDYFQVWMAVKVRPAKTVETTKHMVNLWHELMGEGPASLITRHMVLEFRDKLIEARRSAGTIRNRLGLLRAVVNSYFIEKSLQGESNPFDKVPVKDQGQRVRVAKDRRAFEMAELHAMYSSPLFTERQMPAGQVAEAGFWAPLMGPFTGMRIEELAQMRLVDIEIINGVWTLRICDLDKETQDLKTSNSFRRIPIHGELIRLGFLQYLCELKRRGETRLFPSLKRANKYGIWSNALGKWFGRFLDKLGLNCPQLDYHSFRYNFKQRLNQCGVGEEARDALLGHWAPDDRAGNVYMRNACNQYDFVSLCKAMQKLRYKELDLSALYVQDPWANVDVKLFIR